MMKKVNAESILEIFVECPYCQERQQRFDDLHEELSTEHDLFLRANNCDVELKCLECEKEFIVENITY